MAVLRIPEQIQARVHEHLFSRPGEHFAFLHAHATGAPIFLVHSVTLVPDERVSISEHGWEIDPDVLLEIVNQAIRSGDALVETHNHGGTMPRPSRLDRQQYADFIPYIVDSLSGRPYAATVWSESTVYGEFFHPDGTTGPLRSITAAGARLRQLVSRDDDHVPAGARYERQLPWFTHGGQQQLARLRIALVGVGGTGSHAAIQLPYLGAREFLLIDPDDVDETSGNRTVTATPADIGAPKAIVARRAIKSIAPDATVDILVGDMREPDGLDALVHADVIIGCVDNDGARLVLNELSVAYAIPYLDLGVGIDAEDGTVNEAGGRVAVVVPDGPCLLCMDEIDRVEARYFLATPEQQAEQHGRGYVTGMDVAAPSVVSVNGIIASIALNELALYLSGARPLNPLTLIDLLGTGQAVPAQWSTPLRVEPRAGCFTCTLAGRGDNANLERYALPG